MNTPVRPFTISSRIKSIRFALDGIRQFFLREHNARVHLVATFLVAIGIFFVDVNITEIILLIIVTGIVWIAEIINTAIERLIDIISPGYDKRAGLVKDMAAGAVLLASLIALVTGGIIFIPKLF